ncbi:MAG: succinate dehydrogenase/fumarate reductase iron-sulfur subunit [Arcobacter sp.]|nr:MAG: succinate dehydrogenase/fumarate reductase iron-sulfur subunit [Arcobacter sp.]
MSIAKGREITISVLKFNPRAKSSKPGFVDYIIEETPGMTLFIALMKIREEYDPDLSFDFVCRAGICGSCGMIVNGKPVLGCRTLIANYPTGKLQVMPMPAFELIKDLSVNTGKWMDAMSVKVQSWIVTNKETDISKLEERVEPEVADEVFELDRCIECGICVASCGTKLMRPDFIGAVGLNRVARFEVDPHDNRTAEDFYELIGDDDGIFGCMSLMACEDHCPKHLPLQSKIAYLRRRLVALR